MENNIFQAVYFSFIQSFIKIDW